MSSNRVQKLLFSEYCDFEDMVLIESPFAQTTRDGRGIRQVHLGLTPSNLVLATDVLPPVEYVNVKYAPGVDPEIETFELIAIYPVECVSLSVYRKRKKQALKARFCNNKVLYFELGGFEKRAMFWNLWCERVKFLCPGNSGSSRSETSVATSSTGSTLYLIDKKLVAINGTKQIWCRFGSATIIGNNAETAQEKLVTKWPDKYLYLGKNFDVTLANYRPVIHPPTFEEFVSDVKSSKKTENANKKLVLKAESPVSYMQEKELNFGDNVKVNRFGTGVQEGCGNPLYLTVDDYILPRTFSKFFQEMNSCSSNSSIVNYHQLAETAVLTWEFYKANDPNKYRIRHRRRYGFAPQSFLMYGLDPRSNTCGAKFSLQMKRAASEISIRRLSGEAESALPVDIRLLKSSLSHQYLSTEERIRTNSILNTFKSPLTFFWTTGYSYRPKSSKESYQDLRQHLKSIRHYQESAKTKTGRKRNKKFFKKLSTTHNRAKITEGESTEDEAFHKISRKKKHGFIYNMFTNKTSAVRNFEDGKMPNESSFQCLKRVLHMEAPTSAWDFDSGILAEQLTMIERDLFLKIPCSELEVLIWEKSSANAPNIRALLAFSHRTSCLLASEIFKSDTEKARARLVARFISAANKCHRISNFQSCKTIINSLQSPAIYRLRRTWAYLRKKHASKYQSFEILCRLYRDPRLPVYQKTFSILSHNPPFLPYIGDVIARLLGKVPEFGGNATLSLSRIPSIETTKSSSRSIATVENTKRPGIITKIYRVLVGGNRMSPDNEIGDKSVRKKTVYRKSVKFKGLYEYYTDFDCNLSHRFSNLEEAKKFLEKCQFNAIDYNFAANQGAREYLLKSRYCEDKKNFYKSFSIESPRSYYEPKVN